MDHRIRFASAGISTFFTVALADSDSSLLCDQIDRLRRAVATTRIARPFGIDAWVVLPDHMHCIWTLPAGDCDYDSRWQMIKTRFAQSLPIAARRGAQGIWQDHIGAQMIRSDADFSRHLRFCWHDPVRHGFADDPCAWPFSSVHRDITSRRYDWAA